MKRSVSSRGERKREVDEEVRQKNSYEREFFLNKSERIKQREGEGGSVWKQQI